MGDPHAEVGLKPQLSPRGHATKEEELKSLLTAVQTMDLHPCDQHCKLSTCRTSEWTVHAPAAEMDLALAAVDFVGMYMWRLGQARVSAASIVPTMGPVP